MGDLFKAVLLGTVLTVGFFAVPFILTVLIPIAIFLGFVLVCLLLLKLINYNEAETEDKDPKPPP